jgi:hypothetical protein
MENAWQIVVAALAAVWGVVGWQMAVGLALGAWFGDFAGRRYPLAWAWIRLGFKQAGAAANDAIKG